MAEDEFKVDEKFYTDTIGNFEKNSFYPPDILSECPKFRILVVGRTGSGKSTLCSKVFHVPADGGVRRSYNVWQEITFPGQNDQIILHDSGGFEAGETEGLAEIRKFIKDRLSRTVLAERLHCIWYCIPLTGHRHIQSAERKFFNETDLGDIPVAAVFTHFDTLENDYEFRLMKQHQREQPQALIPRDLRDKANLFAIKDFDEIYRRNLEEIVGSNSGVAIRRVGMPPDAIGTSVTGEPLGAQGVTKLIDTTLDMLAKEGLRRLWISAQKRSAELKRKEAIATAMSRFVTIANLNSVPLIPFLGGTVFLSSFNAIYRSVNKTYGLIDPGQMMQKSSTRKLFFGASLKLSVPGSLSYRFFMSANFLGPLTGHVVTAALLKMIAGVIMIHETLFWRQRQKGGLHLTPEVMEETCSKFSASAERRKAAAFIDGSVQMLDFIYSNKQYCEDVLTTALQGQKLSL